MKVMKKILSMMIIVAIMIGVCVMGTASSGAASTGAGLAEWAMRAYNEGWSYVWGGASVGAVDCSGLIWSYCGGNRISMLDDAKANGRDWGYVSDGVPNIHGLGLSRPNHVGVYVGNGMEVDARGSGYGVCYQAVGDRWNCWFKLTAVSYPTTGWVQFNGDSYYYENGEYIVSTTRTIDGVTYSFDSAGVCSTGNAASTTTSSGKSSSGTTTTVSDNGPLKNGSSGAKVEKLQKRLQELGYYNGAIDGDFGDMTEKAFKLFQKTVGLYEDGIAGSDTDYLYASDAPYYVEETEEEEEIVVTEEKPAKAMTTTAIDASADDDEDDDAETAVEEEEKPLSYSRGDYSDEILYIQERLASLGYLEGEADGEYGEQTEIAVAAFQGNNELEQTGVVDEETYKVLFSETAVEKPETVAETTPATSARTEAAEAEAATVPETQINTEPVNQTTELSAKSIAAVRTTSQVQRNGGANNIEFILWLAIMIVIMMITFSIVFAVEKKRVRAKARYSRRFQ